MAKAGKAVYISKLAYEKLEREAWANFRTPQLQLEFYLEKWIEEKQPLPLVVNVVEQKPPMTREEFEKNIANH